MNKLLIILVGLITTITVNAATVEWSLTKIASSPDAVAAAGWIGYILDVSKYNDFSALSTEKLVDFVTNNSICSGNTKSARGVNLSITGGSYSGSETVSSFLVLFNNADAKNATYYINTAISKTTISEGGADGTIAFGTFDTAMAASGSSSGWVAVPEPTSGLLMLLGVASLALRRRNS